MDYAQLQEIQECLDGFLGDGPKEESYSRFVATVPLGRLCKPRDMANAALIFSL